MKRIIPLLFVYLLVSCRPRTAEHVDTSGVLLLHDSLRQIVTVDTVRMAAVPDELLLNGRVTFDAGRMAGVYPAFGGIITDIRVETGDYVRKGDVLAIVRSPEAADIVRERAEAGSQVEVAKRQHQVARELYDSGMAAETDLLVARQEETAAAAELKRLDEWIGVNRISGDGMYALVSPVSGFIVEKSVSRDMQLRPDYEEAVFTVSGLEEVWIVADVYESDISKVKEGGPVRITTLAYKDEEFTGHVEKLSPMLDPESKTLAVRIRLKNEAYRLKPGMFTNVYLRQSGPVKELASIPAGAVIFESSRHYVVVVDHNNRLVPVKIEVYKEADGRVYITRGLSGNECVVTRNALLVYNAIK